MRRVLTGALSLVLLSACSLDVPAESSATITGRLVAGPTCPVETDPPSPGCDEEVVPNVEIVAALPDGAEIRARSGPDGSFRLELPPGPVTITFAAVEGLMGTPEPMMTMVEENQTLDLSDVTYDTGIR